jgi:hypothetical protein
MEWQFHRRCRPDANVVSQLELKPWGVREFSVQDPNVLRIGKSEDEAAEPERFTSSTGAK